MGYIKIGPKRIISTGEGKKVFGFAAIEGYYVSAGCCW